jgi:hypothetical protein
MSQKKDTFQYTYNLEIDPENLKPITDQVARFLGIVNDQLESSLIFARKMRGGSGGGGGGLRSKQSHAQAQEEHDDAVEMIAELISVIRNHPSLSSIEDEVEDTADAYERYNEVLTFDPTDPSTFPGNIIDE